MIDDDDIDPGIFGKRGEIVGETTSATQLPVSDTAEYGKQLSTYQKQLALLPANASAVDRAKLQLEIAALLLALDRKEEAWNPARSAFDTFIENENWQEAVECCNVMFQSDQPASLVALGNGTWLAVTFPVEIETSLAMLMHIIDDTPDSADGAAVTAVAGQYIVDMRANDEQHESLSFLTRNVIVKVAQRHSGVKDQSELENWMQRLELKDPAKFLPRLALVIGSIVEENWWFDRDVLRSKLPA